MQSILQTKSKNDERSLGNRGLMGATKAKDSSLKSPSLNGTEANMHFVKMHGLGNDFVMVTDAEIGRLFAQVKAQTKSTQLSIKQFCAALAKVVCDRHFGIGADGLIAAIRLDKSADRSELAVLAAGYPDASNCDLAWLYINSDGSYADMCGNGLRCLGAFVQSLGWVADAKTAEDQRFTVATAVYPVLISLIAADIASDTVIDSDHGTDFGTVAGAAKSQKKSFDVTTRLAGPKYSAEAIPLKIATEMNLSNFIEEKISLRGETIVATCLSMGNPHCVIFDQAACGIAAALDRYAADIEAARLQGETVQKFPPVLLALAEDIQNLSLFPQGVNVEFVRVLTADQALVFVVERGCGATLACASGAAAVLAAGVKTKRLNKKSYVILPGGKLKASLSLVREQEYIDLTGPAVQVFSGDFAFDASTLFEGSCR